MNRTLPALARSAALCFPALAQPAPIPQPKPAIDEPAMKMGAGISAMPGEQMQKMHATMGKWMPMMTKMMKRQWMVSSAAGADRLVEPLCGHDNSADQLPVIDFQAAIRAPEPRRSRDLRKKLASPPRGDGILPARRLRRA